MQRLVEPEQVKEKPQSKSGVKRKEDYRLITGKGTFVDDLKPPQVCYAHFVRSPYPHAAINSINTDEAKAVEGVLAVLTAKEIRELTVPLRVALPGSNVRPLYYEYLASNKVRFSGQPVALIIAKSPSIAEDAAERVHVNYKVQQAVLDAETAMKAESPLLYEEWNDNIFVKSSFQSGDLEGAFRDADHVFREKLKSHRYTGAPLETRSCLASYDKTTSNLTCWMSKQDPHVQRILLSQALGLSVEKIRVISPDVGGAFGIKLNVYPEDVATAAASILLGRPVKWIESRSENLSASVHAREQMHDIQVAVRADGTILGIHDRIVGDMGAGTFFPHSGVSTLRVTTSMLTAGYRIPNYSYDLFCVVTNKCPFGAYRGFGKPEATFVMERMFDIIAGKLGIDPLEIRKRNLVRTDEYPYTIPTGVILDSGSLPKSLELACQILGYEKFRAIQGKSRQDGRHIGIGMACCVESTASTFYALTGRWIGHDTIRIKLGEDGILSIFTGSAQIGTGLETSLARIASEQLGLSLDEINVVMADTDLDPFSSGNWGSRSGVIFGSLALKACSRLKQKIFSIASHILKSEIDQLEVNQGVISSKLNREHKITLKEVAWIAYQELDKLPPSLEPGLEATTTWRDPQSITYKPDKTGKSNRVGTCSNAAHVVVVEADPLTGNFKILRYVAVHDAGELIDQDTVEGQTVGGIAQGISGTLFEELAYDPDGQLINRTFMDYLMPTSLDLPVAIELEHIKTPSTSILGGFKGAGEAGTIPPPAALANAVEDALKPFNIRINTSNLKPEVIWKKLH